MKRILLVLLALVLVFTQVGVVVAESDVTENEVTESEAAEGEAEENVAEEIEVTEGEAAEGEIYVTVTFNGEELEFDVPPQIMNSRTMVPLRAIFEKMGAEVDWENDTQTVTATKGDTVVVLVIGDQFPTINGEVVEIDQPGVIVDSRTLAPLRFVAEAFGGEVDWIGETWTATITLAGDEDDEDVNTSDVEEVEEEEEEDVGEAAVTKMLYQGHGSFRITAKDGTVVYIDPYIGDGYDLPADIILVTHQHRDHNEISLITQNPD